MKLLLCKRCQDVFKLQVDLPRQCLCGATKGHYTDGVNAVYSGDNAVPIGFANSTFADAVNSQPKEGMGKEFKAFVIPKVCDSFVKE
jgi:hypothetical protein